ncbi:SCO7613 C-terminal domain-containing membrane protein [Okibacterium fritillariae]|uniref:Uncharacterized protein n=1 Tax=Okibacterium fritillariae TaxID=123320 RepID=A0A1T5JA58_9MICO|nr:hypothetical protein [Okibacterium fritillariae]SKC48128.1 hypothetical protein SAMN06309945_1353 [Okibacterium fritillariae]
MPPFQPGPFQPGQPTPSARPRRSGVQILLLVAGVTLVGIAALFFAVIAYVLTSPEVRVVLLLLAAAAVAGLGFALRRRLPGTAEALVTLGIVFVLVDGLLIRSQGLFGSSDVEGATFTGIYSLVASAVFLGLARSTRMRAPSVAAAILIPFSGFFLLGGLVDAFSSTASWWAAGVGGGAISVAAAFLWPRVVGPFRADGLWLRGAGVTLASLATLTAVFAFPELRWTTLLTFGVAAALWVALAALPPAPAPRPRAQESDARTPAYATAYPQAQNSASPRADANAQAPAPSQYQSPRIEAGQAPDAAPRHPASQTFAAVGAGLSVVAALSTPIYRVDAGWWTIVLLTLTAGVGFIALAAIARALTRTSWRHRSRAAVWAGGVAFAGASFPPLVIGGLLPFGYVAILGFSPAFSLSGAEGFLRESLFGMGEYYWRFEPGLALFVAAAALAVGLALLGRLRREAWAPAVLASMGLLTAAALLPGTTGAATGLAVVAVIFTALCAPVLRRPRGVTAVLVIFAVITLGPLVVAGRQSEPLWPVAAILAVAVPLALRFFLRSAGRRSVGTVDTVDTTGTTGTAGTAGVAGAAGTAGVASSAGITRTVAPATSRGAGAGAGAGSGWDAARIALLGLAVFGVIGAFFTAPDWLGIDGEAVPTPAFWATLASLAILCVAAAVSRRPVPHSIRSPDASHASSDATVEATPRMIPGATLEEITGSISGNTFTEAAPRGRGLLAAPDRMVVTSVSGILAALLGFIVFASWVTSRGPLGGFSVTESAARGDATSAPLIAVLVLAAVASVLWQVLPAVADTAERLVFAAVGPLVIAGAVSVIVLDAQGDVAPALSLTTVVLAASALVLFARRSPLGRRARLVWDASTALVGFLGLFAAVGAPADVRWLSLLVLAVAALVLASGEGEILQGDRARHHIAWVAIPLGLAALCTLLADGGVTTVEAYTAPVAGLLAALAALFVWRRPVPTGRADGRTVLAAAALAVLVLPSVLMSGADVSGPNLLRPAALLLGGLAVGSLAAAWPTVIRGLPLRRILVATSLVAIAGTGLVRGLGELLRAGSYGIPDMPSGLGNGDDGPPSWLLVLLGREPWPAFGPLIEPWTGLAAAALVVLAIVWMRERDDRMPRAADLAIVLAVIVFALPALVITLRQDLPTLAPFVSVILLSIVSVLAAAHNAPPLGRLVRWTAVGAALVITAAVFVSAARLSSGAPYDADIFAAIVGAALVVGGLIDLGRRPALRSWPALGPGLLVALVPSLLADYGQTTLPRIVLLGVAAIAVLLFGVLRKLQAPVIIGAVVLLLHGLAQLWPWISDLYSAIPWWLWVGVGGILLIVVAATYEKRIRDARAVARSIRSLR